MNARNISRRVASLVACIAMLRLVAWEDAQAIAALASGAPNQINAWIDAQDITTGYVNIGGAGVNLARQPLWDFGDGTVLRSWFPAAHTYTAPRSNYVVRVTGTFRDGKTASATVAVTFPTTETRKQQTITWLSPTTQPLEVGTPYTVEVVASSGLPVTVLLVRGTATFANRTLILTDPGTAVLRAVQAGDRAWSPVSEDREFGTYPFGFEVNPDGTVTLTKVGWDTDRALAIPTTIGGRTVTRIGDRACALQTIVSLTLPETIIEVGADAFFWCASLTNVVMGSGVVTIGDKAFERCRSLISVTLGNSIVRIGNSAFSDCAALASITIPDSVTSLGDSAFEGCVSLTRITIGNGVTTLGPAMFRGLRSLTNVAIPDSITSIGAEAFRDCSSLTTITIPDSVTSIGDGAFGGCTGLTSITIPDSVSSIGNGVFRDCAGLTRITIPDSVTSIGDGAFGGCTGLTSVTIPDSVSSIGDGAFWGCASLTSITIPDSVSSIGDGAFWGCASLTSITIPNSVTSIGNGAFGGCTGLRSITVQDQSQSYCSRDGVLYNKSQSMLLQFPGGKAGEFAIPATVTNISPGAFFFSGSLTRVSIPDSVSSIESVAWDGCAQLTRIDVTPLHPYYTTRDGVLFSKIPTTLLRCPEGKIGSYAIPTDVAEVAGGAFGNCAGLISVTIPASVDRIREGAFAGCWQLTEAYFEGGRPSFSAHYSAPFEDSPVTIYRLPGTGDWGDSFFGHPIEVWKPRMATSREDFGAPSDPFGFTVAWARGRIVVVEASPSPDHLIWTPVSTLTLTDGASSFTDPEWKSQPARFYRVRGQ